MSTELTRFSVTIEGNPGAASANKRLRPVMRKGKPAQVTRSRAKTWTGGAVLAMRAKARGGSFAPGPLVATITAYWPRLRRVGPAKDLALGDVDAVVKDCLDALEKSGVVGDDGQVTTVVLRKCYGPTRPRVEIEVVRA